MKITKTHKQTMTTGRTARRRQFGVNAAKVGKTKMVKVLQGNYGYGWDDLCQYEMNETREIKEDLKAYRENQPADYRVIQRRVPNPDYKEIPVEQSTLPNRRYTVRAADEFYDEDYDPKYDAEYHAHGFFDEKYRDLEDYIHTDDWTELEEWCHEKLCRGDYVELDNGGPTLIRIDPDEYLDNFEGEFPIKPFGFN